MCLQKAFNLVHHVLKYPEINGMEHVSFVQIRRQNPDECNKHIPVGVSLNGERLIVVRIVNVDYLHSFVFGGSLIIIRPEGTKSNR